MYLREMVTKSIKDRVAIVIVAVLSSAIGSILTLVGGAISFQYTSSERIFAIEQTGLTVDVTLQKIQDEVQLITRINEANASRFENINEKVQSIETRNDRIESKVDQILLKL